MLAITRLAEHLATIPDHIAFSEGDRQLSYRDLALQAIAIGKLLRKQGVRPGDRVAVLLPRGIDATRTIFATLVLGATYVPLDIYNPASRLNYITNDVQPRCIVGKGGRPEWCEESLAWLDLDTETDTATEADAFFFHDSSPEALAAILYTSGSTGAPKGVAISHRAVDAFVEWSAATFAIDGEDCIGSLAPFHFDLSLFDLFAAVSCGAHTGFIPQNLTLAPSRLVNWLEEQKITTWYTVPSILGFLAQRGGLDPTRLPALKRILFAGEVFPMPALRKLASQLPQVALFNLFGPTETNVCTYWPVDRDRLESLDTLPIGDAACRAALGIADSGELLVSGPCVMSGYWHQGALRMREGKAHHTGDHVSRNSAGELLYHGRMDRMLKSSGYRIEPAEIETAINRFEGVEASVVIGESDPISGQRLVAIIVGKEIRQDDLRAHLRQQLASYMQPYRFVQLESLPLLSNGKVDYQAVRELA